MLIGRRHKQDNNAWFHNIERVNRGRPRHQLLMHPDDLAERGIADGDLVTVTSRVGAVTVDVQASDDMMRGVVSLPHGYGHQVDGVRLQPCQQGARRLDQRPDRPRPARPLRQRRAQRRPRHRGPRMIEVLALPGDGDEDDLGAYVATAARSGRP